LEVIFVALDVGLVLRSVIDGEQDSASGESGFQGVKAGYSFAGFGDGTGGELGVFPVGSGFAG
jgi:hypothetical protein